MKFNGTIPFGHLREAQTEAPPTVGFRSPSKFCPFVYTDQHRKLHHKSPTAMFPKDISEKQHPKEGERLTKPKNLRLAQAGLFAACAIALSAIEGLFPPLPMLPPGAKPGLSNLAILCAAQTVGGGCAFGIALCKAVFAFFTRGVTAGLMSLCGGIFSTAVMLCALRCKKFGCIGIGVCGAVAHNLAQLGVASVLLTAGFVGYLPWLLCFAVLTGTLTGALFGFCQPALSRIADAKNRL